MYYLLTESFKEQERKLTQTILGSVPADCVYLLGSTLATRRTESIFMTDVPSYRQVGHYHILVLVSDEQDVNVVQDIIENRCQNWIPVTALVLRTSIFNTWLAEGHRFAHAVCKIAMLLYGSLPSIPPEAEPPVEEMIQQQNQSLYTEGHNKVTEFIAGAELYMIRKQTKMAAFMLHQAAEQALHYMFHIHTGMYLNTHSIDKLVRYCSMVCYQLPEIFPRNNEKDEHLFQLLQKAYVGGRYNTEYEINMVDLESIMVQIKKLKGLIQL